jgi:hypothetical protein
MRSGCLVAIEWNIGRFVTLSSRGLGHRPFTAVTRVRIPLGSPRLFIGEIATSERFLLLFRTSESIRALKTYERETRQIPDQSKTRLPGALNQVQRIPVSRAILILDVSPD